MDNLTRREIAEMILEDEYKKDKYRFSEPVRGETKELVLDAIEEAFNYDT